jgi:hypothetical protein
MGTDAYAYCAVLTRDQWAWEFLRRNPDYRADYRRFITLWHALEADYGAPPNRDFPRWKQDPRAYGPLPGGADLAAPSGELCTIDDERVLLECWMGAKWGYYKFPLDPDVVRHPSPTNCPGGHRHNLHLSLIPPSGSTSASTCRYRYRRNWRPRNSASPAAPPNCGARASPHR